MADPTAATNDDPLQPSLEEQVSSMRYTIQELLKANTQQSNEIERLRAENEGLRRQIETANETIGRYRHRG